MKEAEQVREIAGGSKSFTAQEAEKQMGIVEKEGRWALPDGREVIPKSMVWRIMKEFHRQTHWGVQTLVDHFGTKYMCIGIYKIAKRIVGADRKSVV